MMGKKNDRPTAATAERSAGTIFVDGGELSSTVPREDYNPYIRRVQGHIESLLLPGRENAVTTQQLLATTGIRHAADRQREIERERAAGALILSKCTDGGGYYLPANRGEIARYEQTLRRRALSTLRTLRSARRALKDVDGQMEMGCD